MKILTFTDIHSSKTIINRLIEKSKDVNILVTPGDLTELGHNLEEVLKMFQKADKKLVVVPGNHENYEELKILTKKYKYIVDVHLKKAKIDDIVFFGHGCGGFSYIDYELKEAMKNLKFDEKEKLVFITHGPPYGTKLDKLEHAGFRGSKTATEFIKKFKPDFCFCGHLHENERKIDKIGKTVIINPGKYGMVIEV
ncbi:metallophosphoesterase family protein [Candidatus Woesearchaeota archaeon]|nr:metallophosphoesterase family protein [Candidatus Woesearchaeota archaeon]